MEWGLKCQTLLFGGKSVIHFESDGGWKGGVKKGNSFGRGRGGKKGNSFGWVSTFSE